MTPKAVLPALFRFLIAFLVLVSPGTAHAQRLVFQTGDSLYTASADGQDPRRLLSFGTDLPVAWAISPDGRRIVWATSVPRPTRGEPEAETGLISRPLALRLTDIVGRHIKPLTRTDTLRDRQGKRITQAGIPASDLPPLLGADPFPARENLDSYELRGLIFSADSRTLYLACTYTRTREAGITGASLPVTFALDAATGVPVVDAQGRWKSLAPVAPIEARGGLLAGAGLSIVPGDEPYYPLLTVNLGEGTRQQLYTLPAQTTPGAARPAIASVQEVALAPENRAIVVTAGLDGSGGLWRTDKFSKSYTQVMAGTIRRPRFSSDGTQLFVLLPRAGVSSGKIPYDLYTVPFSPDTPADPALAPAPVLIRQNVDWFDLVPE